MTLAHRFLLLPTADKWLLIKAAFLLEAIKLSMRLLPFQASRRLWSAQGAGRPMRGLRCRDDTSADKVTWAVEVASRYTPGAKTCLNQALAAQVLLARRGRPAILRVGVAKTKGGQFRAHAWVESDGKVVLGGSGVEGFVPFAAPE
jgi:hypothetical protein